MPLKDIPHQKLVGSGWNTRGYLPHFDGTAIPQFITLKLADAIPLKVIDRWKKELQHLNSREEQILLQRIDVYLDQGYGSCYLKDPSTAAMVEESLLTVMPNHTHSLLRRFEDGRGRNALRQKSVRVLQDGGSDRWGRPGTAALRQKSVRVLQDGASDRRGRPGTDAFRQSTVG